MGDISKYPIIADDEKAAKKVYMEKSKDGSYYCPYCRSEDIYSDYGDDEYEPENWLVYIVRRCRNCNEKWKDAYGLVMDSVDFNI